MTDVRKVIYFENATDDVLDELYDKFNEVDFFYGDERIKFKGSAERFQELMRACDANGLIIKAEKLI